ncbi:MAG: hypothetical protein JRH16_00305 [Deltaproteobacteria bacterium]|nr:hypothetical protein [Deltaproteobacteria bacterium]
MLPVVPEAREGADAAAKWECLSSVVPLAGDAVHRASAAAVALANVALQGRVVKLAR